MVVLPVLMCLCLVAAGTVVVSGGSAAVDVESLDEASEDSVRIPVVDRREFVQDKFLCCPGEETELIDGFL